MNVTPQVVDREIVFASTWDGQPLPAAEGAPRPYTVIVPARQAGLREELSRTLGPDRVVSLAKAALRPPPGHLVLCSRSSLREGPDDEAFVDVLALLKLLGSRPLASLDVVGMRCVAGPPALPVRHPLDAVHLGLARTAAREYHGLAVRTFSAYAIDRAGLDRIVSTRFPDSDRTILVEPDHCYVERLGPIPGGLEPCGSPGFKPGGRYLILGGSGGLGRMMAAHLADRYEAQVTCLSRHPPDRAEPAPTGGAGQIHSIGCDLRDGPRLARVIDELWPLDGVIHSALSLKDRTIAALSPETYLNALHAKVHGTVNLLRALDHRHLDFVLFFSSIQSWLANPGQGAYTAACLAKDALAALMHETFAIDTKTVNWGY